MLDFGTVTIGLVILLCFALWKHAGKFKGHLESLGIPMEPTFLIFGEFSKFFLVQNIGLCPSYARVMLELIKQSSCIIQE